MILQSQLGKLDLVNREEFDIQTQVLLRTREKLTAMEQRLSELEAKFENKNVLSADNTTKKRRVIITIHKNNRDNEQNVISAHYTSTPIRD